MISAIYASLSAFLIVWLSLNVIKNRYSNKVSIGNGGYDDLKLSIAAQSNAIEYIPIALLLLFSLEYNQANILIIHAMGIFLILGRMLHARAMLTSDIKKRVLAMKITLYTITGLAVINLLYLPYTKLFQL